MTAHQTLSRPLINTGERMPSKIRGGSIFWVNDCPEFTPGHKRPTLKGYRNS